MTINLQICISGPMLVSKNASRRPKFVLKIGNKNLKMETNLGLPNVLWLYKMGTEMHIFRVIAI